MKRYLLFFGYLALVVFIVLAPLFWRGISMEAVDIYYRLMSSPVGRQFEPYGVAWEKIVGAGPSGMAEFWDGGQKATFFYTFLYDIQRREYLYGFKVNAAGDNKFCVRSGLFREIIGTSKIYLWPRKPTFFMIKSGNPPILKSNRYFLGRSCLPSISFGRGGISLVVPYTYRR